MGICIFFKERLLYNLLPEVGAFRFFTLKKWKPSYAAEMTTRMQYKFTAQYFTRNGNCLIHPPENCLSFPFALIIILPF